MARFQVNSSGRTEWRVQRGCWDYKIEMASANLERPSRSPFSGLEATFRAVISTPKKTIEKRERAWKRKQRRRARPGRTSETMVLGFCSDKLDLPSLAAAAPSSVAPAAVGTSRTVVTLRTMRQTKVSLL